MCDVTANNFQHMWPEIRANIDSAAFVAFDCEFSSLNGLSAQRNSLFDSLEQRYTSLRASMSHCLVVQCGLSVFVRSAACDYQAHTYNFYLCPRSFLSHDRCFVVQPSCLEFLQMHRFDFNKFVYDGISFLNESEEAALRHEIRHDWNNVSNTLDDNFIQSVCSDVAKWLSNSVHVAAPSASAAPAPAAAPSAAATPPPPVAGDCWRLTVTQPTLRYQLHKTLRARFKQIWTTELDNEITVVRVGGGGGGDGSGWRSRLMAQCDELDAQFIDSMTGFARVLRHMAGARVPLVGHNCFTDLLLFHSLFIDPLPERYDQFKTTIHARFPELYDTKHIVHCLKANFDSSDGQQYTQLVNSSSLSQLFTSLQSVHMLATPTVVHAPSSIRYASERPLHEAGYDAYMTGCCLLRLAHMAAHAETRSADCHRALDWSEYRVVLKYFRNRINVIRAANNDACLDGPDSSPTNRPQWLHVSCVSPQRVSIGEIGAMLSQHGTVDIRPYGSNCALVATGSLVCARSIIKAFRHNSCYRVQKFSLLRHSRSVRAALWIGVVSCGIVAGGLVLSHLVTNEH